jgi:hypothetical protein
MSVEDISKSTIQSGRRIDPAFSVSIVTILSVALIALTFLNIDRFATAPAAGVAILSLVTSAFIVLRQQHLPRGLRTSLRALSTADVRLLANSIIIVVAAFAYGRLALSSPDFVLNNDKVIRWGYQDKRAFVFLYLALLVAFASFAAVAGILSHERRRSKASTHERLRRGKIAWGMFGALSTLVALAIFSLPQWSEQAATVERLTNIHLLVHLGALQRIREGATPYIEALTQYGPGNQLILYHLTEAFGFTAHGFMASNLLVNAICVALLFSLASVLFGVAFSGTLLLAWIFLPSPWHSSSLVGWALFSRWIGMPVISMLLAYTFFVAKDRTKPLNVALTGAVWGSAAFLSQENLMGGGIILILMVLIALRMCQVSLHEALVYSAIFALAGTSMLLFLVHLFFGFEHSFEVVRSTLRGSNLVQLGISNTIWSTPITTSAALRDVLYTYLMPALYLLGMAFFLSPRLVRLVFPEGRQQRILAAYGATLVGGAVMHILSLWRSDSVHLHGVSVFMGIFLFVFTYLIFVARRYPGMKLLFFVCTLILADALAASVRPISAKCADAISAIKDVGANVSNVVNFFEIAKDGNKDAQNQFELRYSPLQSTLTRLRASPQYIENVEMTDLVRQKVGSRKVAGLTFSSSKVISDVSVLYFFADVVPAHAVTSPIMNIWLQSELTTYVAEIVSSNVDCIVSDQEGDKLNRDVLYRAWKSTHGDDIVDTPLSGQRVYGTLSCRKEG